VGIIRRSLAHVQQAFEPLIALPVSRAIASAIAREQERPRSLSESDSLIEG
jgi:hypothetical protein